MEGTKSSPVLACPRSLSRRDPRKTVNDLAFGCGLLQLIFSYCAAKVFACACFNMMHLAKSANAANTKRKEGWGKRKEGRHIFLFMNIRARWSPWLIDWWSWKLPFCLPRESFECLIFKGTNDCVLFLHYFLEDTKKAADGMGRCRLEGGSLLAV